MEQTNYTVTKGTADLVDAIKTLCEVDLTVNGEVEELYLRKNEEEEGYKWLEEYNAISNQLHAKIQELIGRRIGWGVFEKTSCTAI